jgi:uncharacterized protein (TIGR02145 family)
MDRNFGAASATRADGLAKTRGLYYQFGRKDPFPAASVSLYDVQGAILPRNNYTPNGTDCIVRVQGKTAIKTAVQHPYNFYYPGNSDWVQSNLYSGNSWNNPTWQTSTTKSLFDPCPPGWRLPVDGAWNTFALPGANTSNAANYPNDYKNGQDQAGWEFYMSGSSGKTAFYPATGYRHFATGTMANERTHGYNWSSSSYNSTTACYLLFELTYVYLSDHASRGFGFPVRCVQE